MFMSLLIILFQAKKSRSQTPKSTVEPIAGPSSSAEEDAAMVRYSTIHLNNCVIKGYHHYKIRPPTTDPPTLLHVDREYTNIHDESACLVWIPELGSFESKFHTLSTDDKRQLTLADVAGLPVGHVPREIAPIFRMVLDDGGTVLSEPCGEPIPSTDPWPEQNESGGGVHIPCNYIIKPVQSLESVLSKLQHSISNMKAGKCMRIVQK